VYGSLRTPTMAYFGEFPFPEGNLAF